MLVLTGFILVGRPFIRLWVGEGYDNAYWVGVILIASAYIPSVQTLGVNIQNARNRHQMRSVVYFLVACVNVAASIFLIRRWGEIGTSLGTLIAVLIGSGVFMNIYYHRKIGLNVVYFWKDILRWTVPAGVLCAAASFLMKGIVIRSWGTLLAAVAVYTLVYAVLLWMIGMKREDREMIRETLSVILKRKQRPEGRG